MAKIKFGPAAGGDGEAPCRFGNLPSRGIGFAQKRTISRISGSNPTASWFEVTGQFEKVGLHQNDWSQFRMEEIMASL